MRYKTHGPNSEFAKIKVAIICGGRYWVMFYHDMRDIEAYAAEQMAKEARGGKQFHIQSIEPHN